MPNEQSAGGEPGEQSDPQHTAGRKSARQIDAGALSQERKLTEGALYQRCVNFANNLLEPSADIATVYQVATKVYEQLKFLVTHE